VQVGKIEVMEEVRDQHQIVVTANWYIECASRNDVIASGDTRLFGVLRALHQVPLASRQHRFGLGDFSVLWRYQDAVASCYIEYLAHLAACASSEAMISDGMRN